MHSYCSIAVAGSGTMPCPRAGSRGAGSRAARGQGGRGHGGQAGMEQGGANSGHGRNKKGATHRVAYIPHTMTMHNLLGVKAARLAVLDARRNTQTKFVDAC